MLWGGVVGCVGASVWFLVTQFIFTPLYPRVERWRMSEYFMIRYIPSLDPSGSNFTIIGTQAQYQIFYGLNMSPFAAKLIRGKRLWQEKVAKI